MADFVIYPHAALARKAIARPVDDAMLAAGAALLDAATRAGAYGLAAAHLGLDEPVIVISIATDPIRRDYRILYNPVVTLDAPQAAAGAEGSVSLPGIEVSVARPLWAEVDYDRADGKRDTTRFDGFAARVVQHEIDQMNGVFFLDRVSRLKRDAALRKFQKSQRLQG